MPPDTQPDPTPEPELEATDSIPPRTGYVALVGRPNAGKSTLLNRLVGQHLSIVTAKAQTTWQRVTGLLTLEDPPAQLIFLDTPGLLDARGLLQRSMLGAALEALHEADVVLAVLDTGRRPTEQETAPLLAALEETRAPVHLALNKVDASSPEQVERWEQWASDHLPEDATLHRISAEQGTGTGALQKALVADLPVGPFLYPEDDVASDPVRFFVAELVRETVFEQYDEEIPYCTFCQVEEFREGQEPIYIQVNVYVERTSQKGILIGAQGRAIRALGKAARQKIEHFLGERVYLDLWVKPLKSWRRNRSHLARLGFRVPEEDA